MVHCLLPAATLGHETGLQAPGGAFKDLHRCWINVARSKTRPSPRPTTEFRLQRPGTPPQLIKVAAVSSQGDRNSASRQSLQQDHMAEQGSPADGPQAPQPPAAGPGSDAVAKEQAQPAGSPVQGPAAAAAAGGGTPPAGAWAAAEEEELQRRRRRAKWEAEQEAGRRWDLQRRLADISTDVEFLAREVGPG